MTDDWDKEIVILSDQRPNPFGTISFNRAQKMAVKGGRNTKTIKSQTI
jgi:hypothetical protein